MTSQPMPVIESDSVSDDHAATPFSSNQWLSYFQSNLKSRVDIKFMKKPSIQLAVRSPLLRSLQRFQIGETGEGKHLRKYARFTNDQTYEQCIDYFIKEEQYHALVLAQIIQSMDGTLLSWHWSDLAFIGLRRMLGLKTELFILLIAEIIGKCFYRACAENLEDARLKDAFSLIVLDEIGHLEFHCDFLHEQMKAFPQAFRRFCYFAWSILFFTACMVFVADHAGALKAMNVSGQDFLNDCSRTFHRTATKALLVRDNFGMV